VVHIASRRGRFGPVPPSTAPAAFGAPTVVMGDPLSVPEQPIAAGEPDEEPEPLWLRLPAHLAPYFDLGFCHTDELCPYVVLMVREDGDRARCVEVGGPPEAFLELAGVILALCRSVPCLSHAGCGEAAQREAG